MWRIIDEWLWKDTLGFKNYIIIVWILTLCLVIISIIDLIFTWNTPDNLPDTCNYKPSGWETSVGLIGVIFPILLGIAEWRYENHRAVKIEPEKTFANIQ